MDTIINKWRGMTDPDRFSIKMGIFLTCNISLALYDYYVSPLFGGNGYPF